MIENFAQVLQSAAKTAIIDGYKDSICERDRRMNEIVNERIPTELRREDFYYDLPKELIAQTPAEKRDNSRLLVLDRSSGTLEHRHFYDIGDYLRPEDVLVVNSSKVIPARLLGQTEKTGA